MMFIPLYIVDEGMLGLSSSRENLSVKMEKYSWKKLCYGNKYILFEDQHGGVVTMASRDEHPKKLGLVDKRIKFTRY
jgi:hypothetical protein